jgi:hypothetical protein
MAFSFAWGGVLSAQRLLLYYFPRVGGVWGDGGIGRGAACDVRCSPVSSAVSHRQLCSQLLGRNGLVQLGEGRLSMGKGSRM